MGALFQRGLAAMVLALCACGGGVSSQSSGVTPSSSSSADTTAPVDLAGTWTGTFTTTYELSGASHTDNGSASLAITPQDDGGTYEVAVGGACSLTAHVTASDVKTDAATCRSVADDCTFNADYRGGSGHVTDGTLVLKLQLTQETVCDRASTTAQLSSSFTLTR